MTNREQPDPGDGWRLLVDGELIEQGDEFQSASWNSHWIEAACAKWGCSFDADAQMPYRRRITVDAPPATHHGGDHYQGLAIQPWDYATANRMEYNEGVVVAYVTRWRSKGGVQDLQKAIDHINKLIEFETKEATK